LKELPKDSDIAKRGEVGEMPPEAVVLDKRSSITTAVT
jgi:hypothetical protein